MRRHRQVMTTMVLAMKMHSFSFNSLQPCLYLVCVSFSRWRIKHAYKIRSRLIEFFSFDGETFMQSCFISRCVRHSYVMDSMIYHYASWMAYVDQISSYKCVPHQACVLVISSLWISWCYTMLHVSCIFGKDLRDKAFHTWLYPWRESTITACLWVIINYAISIMTNYYTTHIVHIEQRSSCHRCSIPGCTLLEKVLIQLVCASCTTITWIKRSILARHIVFMLNKDLRAISVPHLAVFL
jgi:hypothetical protein